MRGLKSVACVAILGMTSSAMAANILTATAYNDSGAPGNYTNASSIPVATTGDLLLGAAASSTNYIGNNEANGGTTAPFTDGLTATDGNADISQPTSGGNALFDLGAGPQPWYVEYALPASANGYDLTGVTLISGHQDGRLNQLFDILVSSDGVTFTSLSDGSPHALGGLGSGFNYSPSGGDGGAATSTVASNSGPLVASGAKYIEFVDNSGGGNSIYRELAAYGSPTVPEPASAVLFGLGAAGLFAAARRRRNA